VLWGCGGDSEVVVRVGNTPITRTMVGHWMEVLVAGDYRNDLVKPPPVGLATDPPNYNACVHAAKQISPRANPVRSRSLCQQLYQAVKLQAVNFLINAIWFEEDAREHGETVTPKEIERKYRIYQEHEYPQPSAMQRYLTELHRTQADEYYLIKRNVLTGKVFERIQHRHTTAHATSATAKATEEWLAKWTARTNCQPGYITSQCKQYTGHETTPAPNAILQQLTNQT
jgi:hypothetical protein